MHLFFSSRGPPCQQKWDARELHAMGEVPVGWEKRVEIETGRAVPGLRVMREDHAA